nr:NAD(P)/FAD-dependent oxidoreductase [Frankia gtarii]
MVIVGGGAAGLSAALVLTRSRRKVVVVDSGEPRNAPTAHLHGFLSRDSADPAELLATGRDEVAGYGGEFVASDVLGIEHGSGVGFVVRLADGRMLMTRGVIVATGLRDELPEVAGVPERWGRDVAHCPYCHGYEVRDGAIGVLGGDNRPFTLHQAVLLRQWSDDIVFFPHCMELTEEERERLTAYGVRVVDGEVARLVTTDDQLSGVELADGQVVGRSAVFIGPRFVPQDGLLKGLGCELGDNGWVAVDSSGKTSVPGVWAAGNVVDNPAQLINAASAGSTAAIALNHFFLAEDVQQAVTKHRAGQEAFSVIAEQRVRGPVIGDRRHGI